MSDEDRKFLLDHAYEFVKYSEVNPMLISDIVFTGSTANFNYTKFSDIDVHILCNNLEAKDSDLHEKKKSWTIEHPLTLHGFPVEFYIQDAHEHFPGGQGVFSLTKNDWDIKPTHLDHVDIFDDPCAQEKIGHAIKTMHYLSKSGDVDAIHAYKDKLRTMRKAGLQEKGEFSIENILYKELRNRGLVNKLNAHLKSLQ